MEMRTNVLPALAFAVLVTASGVLHGLHSDRWKPSGGVAEAVQRLELVPAVIGDWRGQDGVIDAETLARGGIKGHIYRRYRNERTGATVDLLIVCGRPGPISVHTPDVCYEGAGYQAAGTPALREIRLADGRTQPLWSLRFRKPGVAAGQLEVVWAWTGGAGWIAPDNPRFATARYPALYKLYAIREIPPAKRPEKEADPASEFLAMFLPQVERILAPTP
jgi:Protein of unknown function (DUF3485)